MTPDWLDEEIWQAFVDMRKAIKKPLTSYAQKLAFRKLERLMLSGENPNEVLEQSIFHNWQGLFSVKGAKPEKQDFISKHTDRNWAQ